MTAVDTPVKGLMVADRPGGLKAGEQPAFIPAGANDPWGLNPTRLRVGEVARPKLPTVTDFHRKWLHDLEECCKLQREEAQRSIVQTQAKQHALASFSCRLRAAILQGEDVSFWKAASLSTTKADGEHDTSAGDASTSTGSAGQATAGDRSRAAPAKANHVSASTSDAQAQEQQPASTSEQSKTSSTQRAQEAAAGSNADAKASTTGSPEVEAVKKPKTPSKPAWALSGDEADKMAQEEEAELMAFAQSLDYEAFMDTLDDPTLKEALQELHDSATADQEWKRQFVQAMNHVSQKHVQQAKDVKGLGKSAASIISSRCSSRRAAQSAGNKRDGDWDSGSVCETTDPKYAAQVALHAQAADFLRDNPDVASVHSFASVRAILAKALAGSDGQCEAAAA